MNTKIITGNIKSRLQVNGIAQSGGGAAQGLQGVLNTDGNLTNLVSLITGPNGINIEFGESADGVLGLDIAADQTIITGDDVYLLDKAQNNFIAIDSAANKILISGSDKDVSIEAPNVTISTNSLKKNDSEVPNTLQAIDIAEQRANLRIWKASVDCASVGANININNAGTSLDNVALSIGVSALLKDQSNPAENGPYTVASTLPTVLVRRSDFNQSSEFNLGSVIPVNFGTVNALRIYKIRTAPVVLGTDPIVFYINTRYSNDVIIDNGVSGIIYKAPNGGYWRKTVDNSGDEVKTYLGTTLPPI